jgi:hypothetical protein
MHEQWSAERLGDARGGAFGQHKITVFIHDDLKSGTVNNMFM